MDISSNEGEYPPLPAGSPAPPIKEAFHRMQTPGGSARPPHDWTLRGVQGGARAPGGHMWRPPQYDALR